MAGFPEKMVVVFFGMAASGKSYLSQAWAEQRGCARFNTDVVRKRDIAGGMVAGRPTVSGIGQGIYTAEFSRRTYMRLLTLAEQALADPARRCVILDGSYQLEQERRQVIERFSAVANVSFIYCFCSEHVTRGRLDLRRREEAAVSDATLEVYLHQCRTFEKPREIPGRQLLELDTDAPLEYLIGRVEQFLAGEDGGGN